MIVERHPDATANWGNFSGNFNSVKNLINYTSEEIFYSSFILDIFVLNFI